MVFQHNRLEIAYEAVHFGLIIDKFLKEAAAYFDGDLLENEVVMIVRLFEPLKKRVENPFKKPVENPVQRPTVKEVCSEAD